MKRTPLRLAAAALALLVLSGCGDDQSASPTGAESASPTYSLEDREGFLASGPDCDELRGWYEQFPADKDGETALRFVEQCQEAPAPLLDGTIYAAGNDRLVKALFADGVTGESRAVAHRDLALAVCSMFDDGTRSLHEVHRTVRDFGGSPEDYAATVDAAVAECPSNADDLRLFETDDVIGATDELTARMRAAGADLTLYGDNEVAGLAAVTCASLRDGDSLSEASMLFSATVDFDEQAGTALGEQAVELFCPSQGGA